MNSPGQQATGGVRRAGRREWTGLAVLALAAVLYAMDLTVLHLAVPAISEDLRPSSTQLLWITDIYGFMVAGCLVTMGTLGDRIGRRRLVLGGAAAFAVVSVAAAFSTSAQMLIACRALLGIAGATLAPSTLSLIFTMFPDPKQRSTAIGVWITGFSAGGAIGPLLGGVLLERFWWGSVFLLAVPVMALLLVLGPRVLPEYRAPDARRVDLASAVMLLVAVLAVVFGIKQIAQNGTSSLAVASILAGLAAGVGFARRQLRLADPMIDLRLFRAAAFSASLATNLLGIFIATGYFLFVAQYLQLVLGLSPLQAGLWTPPSARRPLPRPHPPPPLLPPRPPHPAPGPPGLRDRRGPRAGGHRPGDAHPSRWIRRPGDRSGRLPHRGPRPGAGVHRHHRPDRLLGPARAGRRSLRHLGDRH